MKRPYRVVKHITYEQDVTVEEANSPEEAESIADDLFDEPIDGTIVDSQLVEIYPVDFGALGEAQEDEEEENGSD